MQNSFLGLLMILCVQLVTHSAEPGYFAIEVVDEQTGRGIPLVELRTVNSISFWTDSAGLVAFQEPGLMGQEVYFHIKSPGYEHPADFFKNRGLKLRCQPGEKTQIKLKRTQIAERLYRVTGAGIYRDSVLLGKRPPLMNPTLNGQVMGQDTVIVAPYHGKLYWFWGDTDRVSYPLGNFGASGATSESPANGGLAPERGVDLTYFMDKTGFSRPMCPDKEFGEGLKWIESVFTLRETNGRERLLARVAAGTGLTKTREWHLAVFNDEAQAFQSIARWEIHDTHESAHPFRLTSEGTDYLYLFPNYRVRAELKAMAELANYEAFTCIAGSGKVGPGNVVDRDADGRVRYTWKRGADRLRDTDIREMIKRGDLKPAESWLHCLDIETGSPVDVRVGSVAWNEFRKRWIMLFTSKPGEVWYSEAKAPTGPWLHGRRIADHGRYNFYNVTQHPYFDEENGHIIYFEGTYTEAFSGAPAKTPRYDYNQIMYRLRVDDPRLTLPSDRPES